MSPCDVLGVTEVLGFFFFFLMHTNMLCIIGNIFELHILENIAEEVAAAVETQPYIH